MKKQLLLLLTLVCFSIGSLKAQGTPRQTPEERTKATIEKMSVLNLDADVKAKTEVIIGDYYNAQQKAMQDMRASGSNDRDAMMAKRKELSDDRDVKLKLILTAEQLKKWVDEIEPSLRPQRSRN